MNMTTQERYNDICKRSGLSEEIVRRVLAASAESAAYSLEHGEKATIPGICSLSLDRGYKLIPGGYTAKPQVEYQITAKASQAMQTRIKALKDINKLVKEEKTEENIRINQIQSLI